LSICSITTLASSKNATFREIFIPFSLAILVCLFLQFAQKFLSFFWLWFLFLFPSFVCTWVLYIYRILVHYQIPFFATSLALKQTRSGVKSTFISKMKGHRTHLTSTFTGQGKKRFELFFCCFAQVSCEAKHKKKQPKKKVLVGPAENKIKRVKPMR